MTFVEEKYLEALEKMGGQGRLDRTLSLIVEMHEMLSFQISKEFQNLTEKQLRKRVAEKMYMSDKAVLKLLKNVD